MSDWQEVIEEGQIFYVSPHGNIAKTIDGRYVAIVPATVRFGPFDDLNEAQKTVEESLEPLKKHLEIFSEQTHTSS